MGENDANICEIDQAIIDAMPSASIDRLKDLARTISEFEAAFARLLGDARQTACAGELDPKILRQIERIDRLRGAIDLECARRGVVSPAAPTNIS